MAEPKVGLHDPGPPPGVASRLAELRASYVPEADAEVRRRLASQRPRSSEPFAKGVARRLLELRSLCELADHLQRR